MRRIGLLLMAVALAGCGATTMTTTRAIDPQGAVDVSGTWDGTWGTIDAFRFGRSDGARAKLVQQGGRGAGRLTLQTTGLALSVPEAVRDLGLTGVRVEFEVSGHDVVMRSGYIFTADLKVEGDRMVGYLRDAEPAVRLVLTRVPPPVVAAAAPMPPPAAPAAPAPEPVAPEPPKAPEPVASEPPKAPEPVAALPEPPKEPAPPEPVRPEPKEFAGVEQVKPIYFDFDKSAIRPDDAQILEAAVEWLKTNAEMVVLIEGHTDERGSAAYNVALGERRALAARDYLIANGIEADRISTVSLGNEQRACMETSEECWAKNRRAVFLVKPR